MGSCKFFINWLSHLFVEASSFKQLENVPSLSWSGRHCRRASRALVSRQKRSKFSLPSSFKYNLAAQTATICNSCSQVNSDGGAKGTGLLTPPPSPPPQPPLSLRMTRNERVRKEGGIVPHHHHHTLKIFHPILE